MQSVLQMLLKVPRRAVRLARAAAFSVVVLPYLIACNLRAAPATVQGHSLVFQRMEGGLSELTTASISVAPGPNVTIVSVGRGDLSALTPPTSEPRAIAFGQVGEEHTYTNWPSSGTALYAASDATGDERRRISVALPPMDEVTLAAVTVAGQRVTDVAWNEVLAGSPLTSRTITTHGPATLIAFWWGDAGVRGDKRAVPNNGFQVVDAILESGALVQCAVAVKHVTEAGSYDVTWLAQPVQGAQLWIVAVE